MQKMSREMRHKRNRSKRIWRKCVSAMACIVVFCVTYALILPAITLEKDTFCGIEAHVHEDACYAGSVIVCDPAADTGLPVLHTHDALCYDGETLICQLAELSGHVHTDACYGTVTVEAHTHDENCSSPIRGQLICALAEEEGHVHTDACFVPGETLLCTEAEREGHSHADACYQVESQLTCSAEEGEEHTHGDDCYTEVKTLTCQIPEDPGHTHTGACYEQVLGCGLEEKEGHTHEDACFETVSELICGKEEIPETVTHKKLICGMTQIAPHTHQDGCTDEDGNLICTIRNAVTHQHTEECIQPGRAEENLICGLEAHTHSLICYSDPTADLETAQDWEKTFADLELTGNWRQDVVAIAQTQLGYEESTKNYTLEGEDTKGYTRYGDWYGIPYGDWCAMFASFCLDYAGVEGMPLDCNCPNWIDTLKNANLYHVSGGYAPQSGDLIFFDWNANDSSDHVGIVVEFTPAEGDAPATVRTIEGNAGNCVKYNEYNMDNATIMGYGSLPAQLTEEEQAQVDHVIALIDAMPSADEIDAKVAEFAETGDEDGETAWLEQVYGQVAEAYYYYEQLGETLQAYVTNADKLLELEYIWSVTPYMSGFASDAPTKIASASTKDFIELNLYDYNSKINTNYKSNNAWPGFQWNGGAYVPGATSANTSAKAYNRHAIDFIDFGNSIITDNTYGGNKYSFSSNSVSKNRWNIGNQGGNINAIVEYPDDDYANKPVGMSTGTEVLGRNLTVAGYPWVTNAGSMVDYFSNSSFSTKQNTESIDGLFQINDTTGGYFYNSRWNHAQYSNNKFTLYEDIITPNFITYPFGNFLPFNDITDSAKATQVSKIKYVVSDPNSSSGGYIQNIINRLLDSTDPTEIQLWNMLVKYRDDLGAYKDYTSVRYKWSAKDAIYDYIGNGPTDDTGPITDALLEKMYNIDWDVATNFFFGMEMKMNFMQPKDGLTGKDNGNNATGTWQVNSNGDEYLTGDPDGISDYPMHFYFTGDDDVWVYIDGTLFLDLSGIHRHVGGEIDFVNGKVHYYALSPATGDVDTTPYATYTFAQLLTAAGKSTDVLNSKGTFKDYTSHSFNFYYMERGSGSSVCRLNFNFPLLRQNSISVAKDVSADTAIKGNPDYKFQVLKADSNGNKTSELFVAAGTAYTVYDEKGNVIGTGTTDANGVFTLKAGQRAEFTGIKENAGKYYVRELLEGTVLEQYGNVTVSGESTTTSNNVTVGSDTFTGMDSPVKDMSDGATAFRFINDVDEEKLGTLSVSKRLTEYPRARVTKTYDIEVTLDGVPIPVGTEYTVGAETRKVTTEGIITIAADETAVFSSILAGTEFKVAETSGSAEGYVVTYTTENGYTVEQVTGGVKGVIISSAEVQLIVTNSEKGTSVSIPGTKSMHAYDSVERTYTFRLNEVTDETGTILKEGGIANLTTTATVSGTPEDFGFTLTYVQVDIGTLPATFYYKITEDAQEGILTNTQSFVAEVKVEKDGADGIKATLVKIHGSENNSAAFVNTLTGDLKLEKFVDGGTEAQTSGSFNFTIKLDPGDSSVALKDKYPVTITQASGEIVPSTFTVNDGVITVNDVHHGESIVIHDLPIGTTWTIEETQADGYKVKTTVTVGETTTDGTGTETNGTIVAGDTTVVYTNQQLYELPETGGTGTHVYTMAGLMLMLISTAYLLYRYRKRRREVS